MAVKFTLLLLVVLVAGDWLAEATFNRQFYHHRTRSAARGKRYSILDSLSDSDIHHELKRARYGVLDTLTDTDIHDSNKRHYGVLDTLSGSDIHMRKRAHSLEEDSM